MVISELEVGNDGRGRLVATKITNYLWNFVDPGELVSYNSVYGKSSILREKYKGAPIFPWILQTQGNP
ncbi:hypothetical protein BVX99_01530 [bacterium F16]|nr:hypothetical protein BVX99_01530 [bacterium F16]